VLLPRESTTLTLSVYVDDTSAAIFNTGPRRIGTFLVLHALLGKNYFISISGEYGGYFTNPPRIFTLTYGHVEHTCFANSLARLVRLPGPIRAAEGLVPEENAVNAPREVIRLVNWLMTHAASIVYLIYIYTVSYLIFYQDDLFIGPAEQKLVATIREVTNHNKSLITFCLFTF
jgi:phosphatidylinositol-bisphosphatase